MNPTKLVMFTLTEDQAAQLSAKLDAISAKLDTLLGGQAAQPAGKPYLTLTETAERYQVSRRTLARMMADPSSGLADIVVRVPPITGKVRVPVAAFEKLVEEKAGRRQWRCVSRRRP